MRVWRENGNYFSLSLSLSPAIVIHCYVILVQTYSLHILYDVSYTRRLYNSIVAIAREIIANETRLNFQSWKSYMEMFREI